MAAADVDVINDEPGKERISGNTLLDVWFENQPLRVNTVRILPRSHSPDTRTPDPL